MIDATGTAEEIVTHFVSLFQGHVFSVLGGTLPVALTSRAVCAFFLGLWLPRLLPALHTP